MEKLKLLLTMCLLGLFGHAQAQQNPINWVLISSKTGGIETPNGGGQQTSTAVADFDNDGINDFAVSERTIAPALVWYQRNDNGWKRYVIDDRKVTIEAGTIPCDVDNDGDMDIIAGSDAQGNEVWWWENPYPKFDPKKAWIRYSIVNTGGKKHHDQLIGDFDGDGKTDLVFWTQGDQTLYFTRIPSNPKILSEWNLIPVYKYYSDGQMEQRGIPPSFKWVNEHEGLTKADIDGDGIQDIIGGGMWFKYLGENRFSFNTIDVSYTFSRSAVGQFIKGGRPEVILVVGDGQGPMNLYEYTPTLKNTWISKTIVPVVDNGHSISVIDFDGDGNLDIWNAEMTLNGNTDAINHILLGDGKGNFPHEIVISKGIDVHESEIVDLDGDGDLDILGKPYNGETPSLNIWLQNGTGEILSRKAGAFTAPYGIQLYSLRFELKKDVPGTLAKLQKLGIKEVEVSNYYGYPAKDFKKLLNQNKLKCTSINFGYRTFKEDINTVISDAKLFGAKYVGIGWYPHDNKGFTKQDANSAIKDFNEFGAKVKKAGLKFFYHPHGYEFITDGGEVLMDYIIKNTNPDLVTYELDVFWTVHGGGDPEKYLAKYPGRWELLHLKELRIDTPGNSSGTAPDATSVSLGRGVTNWPLLLRLAQKTGTKKFYIEDEAANAIDQVPVTVTYLNSMR